MLGSISHRERKDWLEHFATFNVRTGDLVVFRSYVDGLYQHPPDENESSYWLLLYLGASRSHSKINVFDDNHRFYSVNSVINYRALISYWTPHEVVRVET